MNKDVRDKINTQAEQMFLGVNKSTGCRVPGGKYISLSLDMKLAPPTQDAVSIVKDEKVRAYYITERYYITYTDFHNWSSITLWERQTYGVYVGTDMEAVEYFTGYVDVFLRPALESYNQANPN